MNYYIDTEFWENGPEHPVRLISIGIACDDGRTFYAENSQFDWRDCNHEWLNKNVKPYLRHTYWGDGYHRVYHRSEKRVEMSGSVEQIKDELMKFILNRSTSKFWGYYADYDWVVFCQIFGRMVDLPSGMPYFCHDLIQLMMEKGLTKEWKEKYVGKPTQEHHALSDARWNMRLHKAILECRPTHLATEPAHTSGSDKFAIVDEVFWEYKPTMLQIIGTDGRSRLSTMNFRAALTEAIDRYNRLHSKPGQQATIPKTMNKDQLEAKNAGLDERIDKQKAPRVTEESIKDHIVEVSYANPFESTPHFTICGIKMSNGFLVTGESAPVSPENFNREIGQELAYKDAFRKLWALEGYVLALEGYVLATDKVRGTSADPNAHYANGKNPSNES